MSYAIELKNVCKDYDGFALSNVSFNLPKGCIMGFIGENGAGKSTSIKLILDIAKCKSGEINVLGTPNTKLSKEQKEKIGVVFDENSFSEYITADDCRKVLSKIYKQWDNAKFEGYMKEFNLPKDKKIKDFSRGMKMKLAIAVALSHNAELLILDEATSGLDPVVRDEILDIFLDFMQDENHAILMSSHIVGDLEKVCDYITFIDNGKILMSEPKDELIERYGLLNCSQRELDEIDASAVVGVRKNEFGVSALVERSKVPSGISLDKASLEDIMLFNMRGAKR